MSGSGLSRLTLYLTFKLPYLQVTIAANNGNHMVHRGIVVDKVKDEYHEYTMIGDHWPLAFVIMTMADKVKDKYQYKRTMFNEMFPAHSTQTSNTVRTFPAFLAIYTPLTNNR